MKIPGNQQIKKNAKGMMTDEDKLIYHGLTPGNGAREMYSYETEKPDLFTDEGQRRLIKVRDGVLNALDIAGAITMAKAMDFASGVGSNWAMMAYVDRLVEIGDIREVKMAETPAGQHRIFVRARQ